MTTPFDIQARLKKELFLNTATAVVKEEHRKKWKKDARAYHYKVTLIGYCLTLVSLSMCATFIRYFTFKENT